MTDIKFCGMTRAEDARLAGELGAAYVGVIFAPSQRRVEPSEAGNILAEAGDARKVGVFGEASADDIIATAEVSGLDVIQLHAGLRSGTIEQLRKSFRGEIWSVVRIAEGGLLEAGGHDAVADAVLVDSYSESGLGGTGRTFDWARESECIRRVVMDRPLIVAGGLDPDNVASAIRVLQPDVVDVSSGVEASPGVKDHSRMRAFVRAVSGADAE